MGGTFDPIHTGHLILAEAACEAFDLDYVLVMPNGNPPHKMGQVQVSMKQRTEMAQLAIADNPHLRISDFEKTPHDYHYTYKTLEFLRQENPDTDYYFILGADSLCEFPYLEGTEAHLSKLQNSGCHPESDGDGRTASSDGAAEIHVWCCD